MTLRIQNVAAATSSLMTSAQQYQTSNSQYNVAYNMAIFTFANAGIDPVFPAGCSTSSCTPSNNLSAAGTAASAVDVILVCSNNYLGPYQNGACQNNNSDEDTEFDTAMSQMNTLMPNPGTGLANSTPQEVLFIVTDGVEDKKLSDSWQTICKETETGSRCQQEFDTQLCTTIKNRGIFIAILYTVYEPLPASGNGSNSWYNSYVAPYQTKIGPNLQSCASPGLYFAVTTDQDISHSDDGIVPSLGHHRALDAVKLARRPPGSRGVLVRRRYHDLDRVHLQNKAWLACCNGGWPADYAARQCRRASPRA